ncbi:hypothetical protein BG011_001019, partial [Mortierella polycephala]
MTDVHADALAGLTIEKQTEIRTAAKVYYSAEPTDFEKQAAVLDLTRTLATVLKPQKPEPYEGAIDTEACFNFIENQEEYFKIAFTDYHTPPNAAAAARTALENLRQNKMTVTTYTHKFRRHLRLIPSVDSGTILH